jgi:hypothetical protein
MGTPIRQRRRGGEMGREGEMGEAAQKAMIFEIRGDSPLPSRADSRTTSETKREICTRYGCRPVARECSACALHAIRWLVTRWLCYSSFNAAAHEAAGPTGAGLSTCAGWGRGTAAQDTAHASRGGQVSRPHSMDAARRRTPEQIKTKM